MPKQIHNKANTADLLRCQLICRVMRRLNRGGEIGLGAGAWKGNAVARCVVGIEQILNGSDRAVVVDFGDTGGVIVEVAGVGSIGVI